MATIGNALQAGAGAAGVQLTWHDGLCSCMEDGGICIQTCCCEFCTASNMMRKIEATMLPAACNCGEVCCYMICTYATNNMFPWWLAMATRREVIQKYGIRDESTCGSCVSGLCYPCSYCQVQREMAKRGNHCGGCCANPPPETSHRPCGAASPSAMWQPSTPSKAA